MKRFAAAILSLVFFLCAQSAFSEVIVVKAEGSAVKSSEDAADLKKQALESALKNSIPEALKGVFKEEELSAASEFLEKDIYKDPSRYVLNYRILSEGIIRHFDAEKGEEKREPPAGGVEVYHVWIEASVDAGRLKKAIQDFTASEEELTPFTIEVLGITGYREFSGLKESLERVDTVRDISYQLFSRGRITLIAKVAGGKDALYESLRKELGGNFVIITEGGNNVVIQKEAGLNQ